MSTKFLFRSIKPTDIITTRSLLTKVFIEKEPLTKHVGVSEACFHSMLDRIFPNLDYKTSIVAQRVTSNPDTTDNDISACLITTPFDASIDDEDRLKRSNASILDLISRLEASFKTDVLAPKAIPENRVLHLSMGATREEYQGQVLLRGLMDEWLVQAGDGRWDMGVAECTNPISRNLLRNKLGWTEGKVISYNTFESNGTRPFQSLDGEAALVYKQLSASS